MRYWRDILARFPLPLLALSASYGVYSFALLSVPLWVAVTQAAAFEMTYIGLSVAQGLDTAQRRRATIVSIGAVVVSIIYNSLASLFKRNPDWLIGLPWYYEIALAILHGAPLALVAYCIADLLLHSPIRSEVIDKPAPEPIVAPEPTGESTEVIKTPRRKMISASRQIGKKVQVVELLKQEPALETNEIAREVGVSPQYVRKLRAEVKAA